LRELERRVLVYDGAMGTSIQARQPSVEDFGGPATEGCNDYLVLSAPHIIADIHHSFLEAGADVLETCTFQSTRLRLAEWGLADQTYELNRQAAAICRRLCDEFTARDGRPRFVAGSMGPTGKLPSSNDPALSDIGFEELAAHFHEQALALIAGGADVLLIETSQDMLEVKAAIHGCKVAIGQAQRPVAVQAQVTLDTSGRMLLGTDVAAALATLEALGVDAVGLNCSTGPEHMREPIRFLCQHTNLPVSCIPNAGLPLNVDGEAVYPLEPAPLAKTLTEFVGELGVRIVGGCCGTTPEHIRQLVAAVRALGEQPANRHRVAPFRERAEVAVASGIRAAALHQDPKPLLVGERVNSQGSRKVKRLLLANDYDSILEIAREQVDSGAHVLDVCVALTERGDEKEQMLALTKLLAMGVEAPLMFDSTEAEVLDAALAIYPGRAIINSTSLEGGRAQKLDKTLPLAVKYGAALIVMTIDEEGMAHTAARKLDIARRIYDIATGEYGLPPHALIYDVLTFPLTTGQEELRNDASETLEGIRLVKQHLPGVLTSLGVSNLSFGVAPHARAALNSVFLYHAVAAGLDLAMVNPAHITPYAEIPAEARVICEDLVFNRREDALARFIQYYEQNAAVETEEAEDPTASLTVEQALHWKILHRKKDGVEALIDQALEKRLSVQTFEHVNAADASAVSAEGAGAKALTLKRSNAPTLTRHEAAVDVLNNVLLPAMKDVGDRFGAGELILPFVLQSAEVMKKAVAHLEQYLEKVEGSSKGKVVLATVYGDVHDIGKNLVNTILSNNGYTVYDLGKQVPINTIIEKAVEVEADAIGLSALLVSTSKQMPLCVQELDKRGLAFPVIVGGAAINPQYGQRILFVDDERAYAPGVFYCKDAFEGLETMDRLVDAERRAHFVLERQEQARAALKKPQTGRMVMTELGRDGGDARSNVGRDAPIPTPPFWGHQLIRKERIRLDDLFACLDLNALYRLQWGAKNAKGEDWKKLRAEFDATLRQLQREAEREGWLDPTVIYGFYPVQSKGQELIVYDPASLAELQSPRVSSRSPNDAPPALRELTRLFFPRQPRGEHLCLADYFRDAESGELDVAAFQVVTVGDKVGALCERLQLAGDYSRAYFVHGLSVSLAEALAEYANRLVRAGLGLPADQGKRYSWGYPACPDLDEHQKVWSFLPAEREAGVSLTTAYQLVPEQSTAAIVIHHPEAKYFSIGSGAERAEQDVRSLAR
jgi:5-methyltetrahydrofolate--homocysteine methyltransferase